MASKRDWAVAYLSQAAEDFEAAKKLLGDTPSVFCMLLQMVFEKVAKAALLQSGQLSLRKATTSHSAASRLVLFLKRNQEYLVSLGQGNPYQWKDVLPLVQELERAHPQLSEQGLPQLEYPWEDRADMSIRWPARDLPIALRMRNPRDVSGPRLLKFAGQLVQQFDQLFR